MVRWPLQTKRLADDSRPESIGSCIGKRKNWKMERLVQVLWKLRKNHRDRAGVRGSRQAILPSKISHSLVSNR